MGETTYNRAKRTRKIARGLALIFLAAALPGPMAHAQESTASFSLEAEAGAAQRVYRVSETITFTLKRKDPKNATSTIHYRVEENGLNILHEGAVPPAEKNREVLAVPKNPGFILVRAWETAPGAAAEAIQDPDKLGNDVLQLTAGAAVTPDELLPSGEVPADFDKFWEGKLAQLQGTPLEILEMVPVDSGHPEIQAWDVKISAPGGKPVSGYFARPKVVKPRSLPGLVIFQGAGVRSAELDVAVKGASWGALCLQVNAHGILNGQLPEYYAKLQETQYDNYSRRNGKDRDQIYFGEMYIRAVRALEYIEESPAWDGKALIAAGHSQGAAQAIAAAALHPKVSAVFAGSPALADLTALEVDRRPGWPFQSYTKEKVPPTAFSYFDTVNLATRVRAPGLFEVGLQDRIAPPSSGYRAYLAYEGPKQMLLMPEAAHLLSEKGEEAYEHFVKEQFHPSPPTPGQSASPSRVTFTAIVPVPTH